jgi:hypothetical protein
MSAVSGGRAEKARESGEQGNIIKKREKGLKGVFRGVQRAFRTSTGGGGSPIRKTVNEE